MTAAPVTDQATPEVAEDAAAPEYVQPADVVDAEAMESAGRIEVFAPGFGALALDPRATELTEPQKQALVAINIDTVNDPQVIPHVRPFIHMCQSRGLDPWRREAYLIGRGEIGSQYRKFTMQVGIDGYRNMAKGTGRLSRVSERLWTGQDDDEKSWRAVERPGGEIVMRRVWWDAWPDVKGHPGIAKVVVEHYDETGRLVETEGEANWEMFAPLTPKYEGSRAQGNRRKATGPDGKPVMELGEFWQKGGGHMLSKCAEALAYRTAFPGAMAGTYLHEEMHRADAIERARIAAEQAEARRRKVVDLRPVSAPRAAEGASDESSAPMALGEIVARAMASAQVPPTGSRLAGVEPVDAEVVDEEEVAEEPPVVEVTAEQRRTFLLDELDVMARLTGSTVPALTRRWAAANKRNVDDPRTTAAELLALVGTFRPFVVQRMRADEALVAAAEVYEKVPPGQCGPVAWLFGGLLPDAP